MNEIRTYFSSRIKEIDPDFKPWKDGFAFDNIPSTFINKTYHLAYQIESTDHIDTSILDNYSISLLLFFKGYRDVQTALDNSMTLANNIRVNIINRNNVFSSSFYNIKAVSMIPEALESNDNSMYVTLEFELNKNVLI